MWHVCSGCQLRVSANQVLLTACHLRLHAVTIRARNPNDDVNGMVFGRIASDRQMLLGHVNNDTLVSGVVTLLAVFQP